MLAEANEVAPPQMESAFKGFGMLPNKPLMWFVATKALLAKTVIPSNNASAMQN